MSRLTEARSWRYYQPILAELAKGDTCAEVIADALSHRNAYSVAQMLVHLKRVGFAERNQGDNRYYRITDLGRRTLSTSKGAE